MEGSRTADGSRRCGTFASKGPQAVHARSHPSALTAALAVLAISLSGCQPASGPAAERTERLRRAAATATPATPASSAGTPVERPTTGRLARPGARVQPGSPAAASSATRRTPEISALPARSGQGRRIVYSLSQQQVWLVGAAGRVRHSHLVSGQMSQPDPGAYRVYSKSRHASSAVSVATMQYMVRFTYGESTGAAIGFHDIPRRPDGTYEQRPDQLGQPVSAGCIRQRRSDARKLWDFAPVGAKVVVTR